MPTYINNNSITVQLGVTDVKAGKTVETKRYYTVSGVTKTSDLPSFNPLLYEADHIGNNNDTEDVTVPATEDKDYVIKLQMLAGSAEVAFNTTVNVPVILLTIGDSKSFVINNRLVDKLCLKFTAASSKIRIEILYR